MKLGPPLEPVTPRRLPVPVNDATDEAIIDCWRRLRKLTSKLSLAVYDDGVDAHAAPFGHDDLNLRARARIVSGTGIVAFRGTVGPMLVSTNWRKVNLRKKQMGDPPRHQGFDEAWRALRPQVVSWIKRNQPNTIVLTGHSLGAALAQLAAFDLASEFPIERVMLFAPPKVGCRAFNEAYARTVIRPSAVVLGSVTDKYLLSSDAIAFPVRGYEAGEPICRIDRLGRSVPSLPSFFSQVGSSVTADGPDLRLNELPRDGLRQPGIDWGPPNVVDQVLPSFRSMAAAGGLWGWAAYIGIATTSPILRALGFHSMAGYAQAFGNRTEYGPGSLADEGLEPRQPTA